MLWAITSLWTAFSSLNAVTNQLLKYAKWALEAVLHIFRVYERNFPHE